MEPCLSAPTAGTFQRQQTGKRLHRGIDAKEKFIHHFVDVDLFHFTI